MTAEEVQVAYWFDEACPVGELRTSFVELTPEELSAISFFYFSEEGTAEIDGKEAAVSYSGYLKRKAAHTGSARKSCL